MRRKFVSVNDYNMAHDLIGQGYGDAEGQVERATWRTSDGKVTIWWDESKNEGGIDAPASFIRLLEGHDEIRFRERRSRMRERK